MDVMSVIIAGEKCKSCGKEFWLSLGHPKWFDFPMKYPEQYELFKELRLSGKCAYCFNEEDKPLGFLFGSV